ncbi:aspartate--tRNA ligase, mitochondrial [[Candida] jaroonii]|uniref:Aspartate--tRNA ligase, mitochondrial n=1 Tax=[Candida] jaroonii TaxID=467808 RepID=A0ACA9YCI6_9ASCO|nr:aspartate--tRNA ligase, mitochondrial [[Candida] jaroonii]
MKQILVRSFIRFKSSLPPLSTLEKFNFRVSTHTINQVNENIDEYLNQPIVLNGHLNRKPRLMAKNSFAEIRDSSGNSVQLIFRPESTGEKHFQTIESSMVEESCSVEGLVKLKETRDGSKQWELLVTNYQRLNESNLDAARLENLKHTNPQDLPPHFRYLQLRSKKYQDNLKIRSKLSNLIRSTFIESHDFTEIETPLLFKSTPEGAREFLVPTRSSNLFYALPQSPQQYKQILMSSGFTRYFQLAKCFRDEDLRADRQPEFTQVDLEMSFVSSSDQVQIVVEDVIYQVFNKGAELPMYIVNEKGNLIELKNFNNDKTQFTKLTYQDALSKYGIDKPDLRFDLAFKNLSAYFTNNNEDFPIVEACVLKQGLVDGKIPKALTDSLNYNRRKPFVIGIKKPADIKWYRKFVEKGILTLRGEETAIDNFLSVEVGDIVAFSDRMEIPYENPTPLGKFRQLAISEYDNKWQRPIETSEGLIDEYDASKVFVGSWVVDFPLFNPTDVSNGDEAYPSYDKSNFESTHHPFTMVKTEDYKKLSSDPLAAHGEHYDLVVNGVEVGGGSRRVHDAKLQQFIFEEILGIENYRQLFGHLLDALSMGCPPHAGLAIGFDRLCAMVVGSSSIRDVIAFPKNQSGVDMVVESPTSVDEKVLKEYFIKSL